MIHNIFWLLTSGVLVGLLMGVLLNRLVLGFLGDQFGKNTFSRENSPLRVGFLNFQSILLLGVLPIISALLTVWRSWSPELLDDLILAGSLFSLAIIDWKSQLIDSRIILTALVLRGVWLGVFKPDFLLESLLGLLVGAGLLYLIGFLYESIRKRQGLGDGDPALLGLIGFWVGWIGLGPVLLIAALSGILVGGFILWRRKLPLFHSPIPFGPFICSGGMLVHLLQQSGRVPIQLELFVL